MQGFSERVVILRHAARNALLPVATAFALGVGYSVGGNVVVSWSFPGPASDGCSSRPCRRMTIRWHKGPSC